MRWSAAFAAGFLLAACSDASRNATDTARAGVDSAGAVSSTARPKPRLKIQEPDTSSTLDEIMNAPTIMREDGTPVTRSDRDPLPKVIGETRKSGGTMQPLPPRDSAYGPRVRIDREGKVTPIRK
jgi:hypothetical protein